MTQDEIIALAREADIKVAHMSNGKIRTDDKIREQWVVCFATMIEESIKERAAKVCEERGHCNECGGGSEYAAAIRSMK